MYIDTKYYKNKGMNHLRINIFVAVTGTIYLTLLPPSILVKLKLLAIMLMICTLVYMLSTSLTWDIYLGESRIIFRNKYSIFKKRTYEFNFDKIEKLEFFVSSRGGPSLIIHSNGKKNSFQTVGEVNAREIAKRISKKNVPTTEVQNIFKRITY